MKATAFAMFYLG